MTAAPSAQTEADGRTSFVTPEGVDLRLQRATVSDRAVALVIDLLLIIAALVVLTLLAGAAMMAAKTQVPEVGAVIWLLGFFVLRNFYFAGFELRPGSATPGKRRMNLRVIARDGGRLTADAVFGRNAMRELELFLPMTVLLSRAQGVEGWILSLAALWTLVFVLIPVFNRDHLRAGDLVAGTMVVKAPRRILPPDLARDGVADAGAFLFTDDQLDAYGVHELQVLETVLRSRDRRTLSEVARRIQARIGWTGPAVGTDQAFLTAYYTALRGRLERQMLFGRRRRDKNDRG